jgi:hypothetical protein
MPARQRVAALQRTAARLLYAEKRRTTFPEQVAMAKLVESVLEIQAPQERIGRDFRGPQNVAAAVGLDVRKGEELAQAAIVIPPHPLMNGAHQPIQRRAARQARHDRP